MQWLLEDLFGAGGDMGPLWDQLTHALACRHCGSSCLHSPGSLVTLFLFMVWQIRRWHHLGKWQQLQPWWSGDKVQGKGLSLLHHVAFLDCLWKQKSEEEEEEEEGEEEEEDMEEEEEEEEEVCLDPMEPHSSAQGASIEEQVTTVPPQLSCRSVGLPKATGPSEKTFTHPLSASRSFPTFQILTNLPPEHKTKAGSHLPQRKSQLFWGLPSLHSESLEAIFLDRNGSSPLKFYVYPSVFFNRLAFLPKYNLLLPQYHSPKPFPTDEACTLEDLEGTDPDPPWLPSPPSLPGPSVPLCLMPLAVDHKGILSSAEGQWPTQQREVHWGDQVLPQPESQITKPAKFSSEVRGAVSGDPSFHKPKPDSLPATVLCPSSSLGVPVRCDAQESTMGQNEDPKAFELAMPAPGSASASLPGLQGMNPTGSLSASKVLCDTTGQKENTQVSKSPTLAPCRSLAPATEVQQTNSLRTPPGYETHWGTKQQKLSSMTLQSPMTSNCQHLASLSESSVSPDRGHCAPDFLGPSGYQEALQTTEAPMPPSCPLLNIVPELHSQHPLAFEAQMGRRENSGNRGEPSGLALNPALHGPSPASEIHRADMQSRQNFPVSVDAASSPNLPFTSKLQSLMTASQGALSEPTALGEISAQTETLWASDTPCLGPSAPLAPYTEHVLSTVEALPGSEATQKVAGCSRNSWVSETPFLALRTPPDIILEPPEVGPSGGLLNCEAGCGDMGAKKNPWNSMLPACGLPQGLPGDSLLGVLFDYKPSAGDREQKQNHVLTAPAWDPKLLPKSVSKYHISSASFEDQSNCKPEGEVVEQNENSCAIQLPDLSSHSVPLPLPHTDLEPVCEKVQPREVPQDPSPHTVDALQSTVWSPSIAEVLRIEPPEPGFSSQVPGTQVEAPTSQGMVVPQVLTQSNTQAWQWSQELELTLKKLQQSPASRSPGPSEPGCSSPVPSTTIPDSQGLFSYPPRQTRLSELCPDSSSHHSLTKASSIALQPVQASPSFSSQTQSQGSDKAEQGPHTEEKIKRKMVAQVLSQGPCVQREAGWDWPGLGKPSNPVLASGKRQDQASTLTPARKREGPRKCCMEAGAYGRGRMGPSSVTAKNHTAQAPCVVEVSGNSQHQGQRPQPPTLPQQLPTKAVSIQRLRRDMHNLHQSRHCPWALPRTHITFLPSYTSGSPHLGSSKSISHRPRFPRNPCPLIQSNKSW